MAESSSKVQLKLLVDNKKKKVLFAEASKDFLDFLFSLMSLPLGQVVKLLTKHQMLMVGTLGNLYGSIESLHETYVHSSENVESVLNPKAPMVSFQSPLLLSNNEFVRRRELYMCLVPQSNRRCFSCGATTNNAIATYHPHVADVPNTLCPSPDCNKAMTCKLKFVESGSGGAKQVASGSSGGFVEGVVTYMVMDNLEVKPMSTISSIALINSFNIKDLGSLEEKIVYVGLEEGLKILQASLESKDVLSSVFLGNPKGV
ncbi:hypothetical protein M5689_001805 [Euphorbia peplus]|nr:hypothetical protein M5689_001805 [Euphorbia peplus]